MIFGAQNACPFAGDAKVIFHGAYHKMGTVWLMRVLEAVADFYDLTLQKCNECSDSVKKESCIAFANHSQLDLSALGDFVGSHMVRDPRDCVISGYFYHQWTNETWAHVPRARFGGLSYQDHLKKLNQSDGLHAEILRFNEYAGAYRMRAWDFNDARILEIKYEDLLENESKVFSELFRHYGFNRRAVARSVRIARRYTFERVTRRSVGKSATQNHLRSGKPGQWKDLLSQSHLDSIQELFGDLIEMMGYPI